MIWAKFGITTIIKKAIIWAAILKFQKTSFSLDNFCTSDLS